MLTKRKILVVIGIVVALLITFYTGVFGLSAIASSPLELDATKIAGQDLSR